MPGPRLPMRKIHDVLRLSAAGLSKRKIAASLGVSATAAGECIRRARRAGLSWPLPDGQTDEALECLLFPPPAVAAKDRRPQPNWAHVHRELRRPGVTLQLLWEEHRAVHTDGYGYSHYCELYRAWAARLSPTMRQSHVAGERMFVDYAGTTLAVIDGLTGEVLTAQLFVAVLGASSYIYAEATWTQGLSDWIGSHTRTFGFMGGVPATVVCDNLRSGITKACFYEPAVNRTYAEMAAHYSTTILPARPYRPRDKSKAEVGVQIATRFIIAKLRNRQFFSLTALNAAIAELVTQINDRVSRHLGASRRAFRGAGAISAQAAAGRTLRFCRMEGMQGRARLPRRDREALLLGAASVAARDGLGAHHRAHDRSPPPWPARCRPCALVLQSEAYDGARAHALKPSALCRLDAGAPAAGSR